MRRSIRPAALMALLVVLMTMPAAADKSKSLYNKGRDAEARQNYESAYDFYKEAYDLKPKDVRYRAAYERIRFLAGASHVHRGQLLRDAGKLDEALAEFQKAAEIDPSSFIAQQEIRRTQRMIESAKGTTPQAAKGVSGSLKKIMEAGGPVELAPISNVPITLKLTEDTKVIYDTVGKLAGINVLFDPDYTSRRVRIELNGVTLNEALEIVALESKTFWRPVTPNTIFIASDTPAKRKEIDQNVIKTFYLSNVSTPQELQDLVNAMRQILEIARIQQLPTQNAIVVRATPDQIALASKLIDDLDKSKPEVIVEVAIMQVNRNKLYNLGVNPPTGTTITLQPNATTTTTTGGTTTTPISSGGGLNLNRLGNLNATDFTITISSATVTTLFSNSDSKLLQNPQIRAVDGQKASLKIGQRVPVATGSFQPGIGGVGINPLVNTQFQYLDVGVNIDITPHVHATREVTLKLSMDISAVDSFQNIGGISQPVIGQRKIEHELRLKEGEVSLLGGMFENQDTKSLSGLPGLSQIPFLKYLFSTTNTEHRENELVFVVIPHIIRGQELSELNERAIDVGTANSIELRQVSRPAQPAPAPPQSNPPAATSPVQQQAPPPQPLVNAPAQPQSSAPTAPQTGGANLQPATAPATAAFMFDPGTIKAAPGSTFAVNVMLSGAQNVYSVPVQINYDPNKLQVINVSNGGLLSQDGQAVALVHRDDNTAGILQVTATRPPGSGGISGQGVVITLTFMAKAGGQSTLSITRGGARDAGMQAIPVSGAQALVNVQ
ncbi:MAG TPA: cohesin domain-containing protein [Terriglobales bacterium]|nr:cohesin domain-containing protein [Terriglobales bacterium]